MTIYHTHHIIPRHMGGSDNPENLVELTIEEHAKAHKLLYEKYGKIEDKIAWMGLAKMITEQEKLHMLSTMAGNKTVEMKVGIHNPNNDLKSIGGTVAIKKMPEWTKQSKWMNNGYKDTRVHIDQIPDYINNGWQLGRIFSANKGKSNMTKNLFWINKNKKNKRVPEDQIKEYLDDGWSSGMFIVN